MGYQLEAILGTKPSLENWCNQYYHATLISLPQNLYLIPLTDALYNEIKQDHQCNKIEGFLYLDNQIAAVLKNLSKSTSIAYVEAEFFAGTGEQHAILWKNRKVVSIEHEHNAINHILQKLGVSKNKHMDEFDTVGLGRQRHTINWIKK